MISRNEPITIHKIMNKFETDDFTLLDHFSENIDLVIEHYNDDTDVSWQRCESKQGLTAVLQQLVQDVFPKGTKILGLESITIGDGWFISNFSQQFWYGVQEQTVVGSSVIISHENEAGQVDYFREVVQSVNPVSV